MRSPPSTSRTDGPSGQEPRLKPRPEGGRAPRSARRFPWGSNVPSANPAPASESWARKKSRPAVKRIRAGSRIQRFSAERRVLRRWRSVPGALSSNLDACEGTRWPMSRARPAHRGGGGTGSSARDDGPGYRLLPRLPTSFRFPRRLQLPALRLSTMPRVFRTAAASLGPSQPPPASRGPRSARKGRNRRLRCSSSEVGPDSATGSPPV